MKRSIVKILLVHLRVCLQMMTVNQCSPTMVDIVFYLVCFYVTYYV